MGARGGRHAASFPSVDVALAAPAEAPLRFRRSRLVLALARSSVLWPVRLRNTSSRLGSRSARPAMGISAASSVRRTSAPALGPFVDRQLDDEVLDDRRLLRQRAPAARPRRATVSCVAERHRDHRGAEVGLELGRRPLGDDAPVVDDHDVAGQPVGLLEVLRGEQHRRALAHQLLDGRPQVLAALGVEARGRLVEEEDGRVRHQRGGQVEAAAHAARVGLEHPVAGVGQPELLEQLVGPPRRHLRGSGGRAGPPCGCSPGR